MWKGRHDCDFPVYRCWITNRRCFQDKLVLESSTHSWMHLISSCIGHTFTLYSSVYINMVDVQGVILWKCKGCESTRCLINSNVSFWVVHVEVSWSEFQFQNTSFSCVSFLLHHYISKDWYHSFWEKMMSSGMFPFQFSKLSKENYDNWCMLWRLFLVFKIHGRL